MKILVTGATGFVGKNLVKSLLKNHDIHAIVRPQSNISLMEDDVNIFTYDGNINRLIAYFETNNFDGVIHLASLFLSEHAKDDIANLISSNVLFGTQLLEACKKTGIKWFINTGTFWQNYNNLEYEPVNLYAATKEAFSSIAKYYTSISNLIFVTLKLNDTFGLDDTRDKIFNLWAKIVGTDKKLKMSSGEQVIDISYIEDVVNAYEVLISHLESGMQEAFKNREFVVTNNEKMSLKELSCLFEETLDVQLNIEWGGREYRKREVMRPYEKGEVVPNWKQRYVLKDAIRKTFGEKNASF